jgi:hypothetical protein
MNINLQQTLHNQNFQPLVMRSENQNGGTTMSPVTLGQTLINSLLADQQDKQPLEARLKRYDLAERINSAGNVIEFAESEISLILSVIEQWQPTAILAQIYKIFTAV